MPQPQWVTPAGQLATIPEGVFYSIPLQATAGTDTVYFRLIAGQLPDGVQVKSNGVIEGSPRNIVNVQGTPTAVAEDVTSKFAIRAFTTRVVNGNILVDRLADRTFSLTVTGQDAPEFLTPAGLVGTFYDGTEASVQIQVVDDDPTDVLTLRVIAGELPPGMILDGATGVIAGVIEPLVGPPGTAPAGYDRTFYDQYPFDFSTRATSKNYQFTLEVTDGKQIAIRTFQIFVYSRDSMTADTTDFTADNTFITADVSPVRTPLLLTTEGDLGRVRADNFYAFKFDAIDFDGDPIEYSVTVGAGIGFDSGAAEGDPGSYDVDGFDRGAFSLPPGLTINPDTGWFYGYIPDQGATEQTYRFAVRVAKANDPAVISRYYYFTITITGEFSTEIFWLTDPDLGTIPNGSVSTLSVRAVNPGGRALQYRLQSGSDSKLPQGLTLQPTGNITGRVSFNTFALDGGTTTFDVDLNTRLDILETTFDNKFDFVVNAFSAESEQVGYQIGSIVVINGGSGYTGQPTVTISAPPATENAIQATAGVVSIEGGVITAIAIGNPGRGYVTAPTITISGGGGTNATAVATIIESELQNAVSVFRTFSVTVSRQFNQPYERLYIKCMPPANDRSLIESLVQNQDIIPEDLVYRSDDPNFGVAQNVVYDHAYGLTSATLDAYVASLDINHYWKNITLGPVKTAQALDADGEILYEVVYSEVVDDLVNNQGQSVGKSVDLPYPVMLSDSTETETVYPNSLTNMRDQVIDSVGQISPALPLWMISKQTNGQVLGFTPAWVIAYVNPGRGNQVVYNISQQFGTQLNRIDFKVDRYELDRSQTHNWDNSTTDTVLTATNISGSGTRITVTFGAQASAPFTQSQPIVISNTGLSGFDGYYYVDTCTTTQLTVLSPKTGTWSSGGTITGQGYWAPPPPAATTFDITTVSPTLVIWSNNNTLEVTWENDAEDSVFWTTPPSGIPQTGTIFDGGSTRFINIADRWTDTDEYDKYLLFPRINILE